MSKDKDNEIQDLELNEVIDKNSKVYKILPKELKNIIDNETGSSGILKDWYNQSDIIKFDLSVPSYENKINKKYKFIYALCATIFIAMVIFLWTDGLSVIDIGVLAFMGLFFYFKGLSIIKEYHKKEIKLVKKDLYGFYHVKRKFFGLSNAYNEGNMYVSLKDIQSLTLIINKKTKQYTVKFSCFSNHLEMEGKAFSKKRDYDVSFGQRELILTYTGFREFFTFYKIFLEEKEIFIYYNEEVITENNFKNIFSKK